MQIKYFAPAFLLFIISTNFAQESSREGKFPPSGVETGVTNCEHNAATLNFVRSQARNDGLIIAIARLGKGEQRKDVNQMRLRKVRQYLTEDWQRTPETIVTAEAERVNGFGRVELYVGGKLLSTILVERNRDLAAGSCQAGEFKYTGSGSPQDNE